MDQYGHKNEVCLEQKISIGSHCMGQGHFMLHSTTFHNVSIYVKCPQKLDLYFFHIDDIHVYHDSASLNALKANNALK